MADDEQEAQLPSGETVTTHANTVEDMKRQALNEFPLDPSAASLIDEDGNVLPNNAKAPKKGRIAPHPEWGEK